MAQIRWLSDLMLFDFEIKYRAGKTNQAADALSQWPENPNSLSESSDDEEEWDTISYEMVCQILDHHLNSTKLPYHVKHEVQNNIMEVDKANKLEDFKSTNIIKVQLREVKIFDSIMPEQMAELHWFMIRSYLKQNPGCQRYTISGQVLLVGYFYSMTTYH